MLSPQSKIEKKIVFIDQSAFSSFALYVITMLVAVLLDNITAKIINIENKGQYKRVHM